MGRVYFDTSYFTGLLENQAGRKEEAKRILAFERVKQTDRFTSILTLNEFFIGVYDRHKHAPDCDERVRQLELQIRSIARVVDLSPEINRSAARLQSVHGEIHRHAHPAEPRDRKFRWDALHIATAVSLGCDRIYAWDGKWSGLPAPIKDLLGEVIAPAVCPDPLLFEANEPPD